MEWERYARSIWPGGVETTPEELRDHAEDMLRAVVADMETPQTAIDQQEKSFGTGPNEVESRGVNSASRDHAESRSAVGFDLRRLVAEYRALRACVIHLWQESDPDAHVLDLDDIIRFNEAIDQLLAESVLSLTLHIDRSREMFLGILGHDLRNPLSAVAMLAEMLHRQGRDPSSTEMARQISTHTRSMVRMVDDLLEYAAMRIATSFVIMPAPMDLLPLCRDELAAMEAIYPNRPFEFEHQGALTGEWDASRVKQLLSNLLGNAAQHGAESGPVVLSAAASGEDIVLSVRNQGPAIPRDQLETLFEPMKRYASGQVRGASGGVGLGLYIAHEVAVAHGGAIKVESDAEATVFTVRLPRICRRPTSS